MEPLTELELTRAVLEAAPDAILVSERDGSIVLVNQAAERLFGYSRAEFATLRIEQLVPEGARADHRAYREGYRAAPRPRPMGAGVALTALRKDGTVVPVEIALSPVSVQERLLVVSAVRDVAERRRADEALRESERRFHAIFDAAFQFIGLLSVEGRLLEANTSAIEFVGTTSAEVVGRMFWETPWWSHSPVLQARLREAIAAAARGEFVRFDATHPRPNGILAPVDFSLKPALDEAGRVAFLVPEGRDLTSLEEARLAEARARAASDQLRDDLSRMVVHDLKNPVSGMLMLVQLLQRKSEGFSARALQHLQQLERTCKEMLRFIQTLLEVGRLQDGRMPVETRHVELAALAEEVVRECRLAAEQSGCTLRILASAGSAVVRADAGLLQRVLMNLVMNAIQHSGSREIRVELAHDPGAGTATVAVVDDGCGIPAEEQGRVFERFVTLPGKSSSGTGLGLPFCKLAVEAMRGRITLSSLPSGPTCFTVTLSMPPAEEGSTPVHS